MEDILKNILQAERPDLERIHEILKKDADSKQYLLTQIRAKLGLGQTAVEAEIRHALKERLARSPCRSTINAPQPRWVSEASFFRAWFHLGMGSNHIRQRHMRFER